MQTLEELKAQIRAKALGQLAVPPKEVETPPTEVEPTIKQRVEEFTKQPFGIETGAPGTITSVRFTSGPGIIATSPEFKWSVQKGGSTGPAPKTNENREEWLNQAVFELGVYLPFHVPTFRVSVGFPIGKGKSAKMKGHTLPASQTKDGIAQVFITPIAEKPMDVLTVLLNEILTIKAQESGTHSISYWANTIGMVRQTEDKNGSPFVLAQGSLLAACHGIIARLGVYPHAGALISESGGRETALKAYCAIDGEEHYKIRISKLWAKKLGTPICPCHNEKMRLEHDTP